ncbi:hypothetical protein MVEN_01659900 [Mycena venus]|uniref:F-box domain-containing protein n=1 Tax=Mycena venus TaxID=2733690 RepID=A0A8H6XPV2_9AGAR|nr:hypothetical protein MVEN_01659900 [Mycena venus]
MLEIPSELWVEIFQHIPRRSLASVNSVSSHFRDISHPLLFKEVNVNADNTKPSTENLSARLFFLSSDETAPLVRHLKISMALLLNWTDPIEISSHLFDPRVQMIVRAIPCFRNLCILTCVFPGTSEVDLSRLGLSALKNLDELTITAGSLFCTEVPHAMKIRAKSASIISFGAHGRLRFLPVLDLSGMRPLRVALLDKESLSTRWLRDDVDLMYNGPHKLSLICGAISFAETHRVLARFPSVRILYIGAEVHHLAHVPTDHLTSPLESFGGPSELLPLVLPATGCSTLRIQPCSGEALLQAVCTAGYTPSVTTLHITLSLTHVYEWTAPHELFAFLPCVTSLQLTIPSRWDTRTPAVLVHTVTPNTFMQALVRIFCAPQALRTL